jgi:hypothetical protein
MAFTLTVPHAQTAAGADQFVPAEPDTVGSRALENPQIGAEHPAREQGCSAPTEAHGDGSTTPGTCGHSVKLGFVDGDGDDPVGTRSNRPTE